METKRVRAGKDTILALADRAKPVDIVAELIWNALDAEAMNVEVTIALGELGAPEEIVVRDDGHGMTYQQVPDMFLVHGESWKTGRRFSPNIDRPMHGQLGRGRFLVYGIADRVEWRSVAADANGLTATVIYGRRSAPNEFSLDGPQPSDGMTGTTVRLVARQDQRVTGLVDGDVNILAEWKSEGVYPYLGRPTSPTEEVEREIFDIVQWWPALRSGGTSSRRGFPCVFSKKRHVQNRRGPIVSSTRCSI